jgi:excisionase family DNA binding protein
MLAWVDGNDIGAVLLLKDVDVAARLQCSRRHIWEMVERGELCAPVRLGRLVRWRTDDLETWVKGLPTGTLVGPSIKARRGRPRRAVQK